MICNTYAKKIELQKTKEIQKDTQVSAITPFDPFDVNEDDPFDVNHVNPIDTNEDGDISVPDCDDDDHLDQDYVPEPERSGSESEQPMETPKPSHTRMIKDTEYVSDSDCSEREMVYPLPSMSDLRMTTEPEKKKPKRPCFYCGEEQFQLVRHLKRKHKTEDAVVAAQRLPKAEQCRAFEKIRKDVIFKTNLNNMEKCQTLIRERRQGSSSNADIRMCNGCRGFFDRKQMYRHRKRCVDASGTSCGSINFSTSWKSAESLGVSEEFKSVLGSFRDDEAGRLCQSDHLIVLLDKKLWAKSIKKEKHVVMADMRVLANLVLRMRILSLNEKLCGYDVLESEYFDTLCDSIRDLTTWGNGEVKSGLKLKVGFVLKKSIKIAKGNYIQTLYVVYAFIALHYIYQNGTTLINTLF